MNKSMYPCIWCNHDARVMADFYVGTFPDSRVVDENQAVVVFTVNNQRIMLLNGGDMFNPTPTIALRYLTSEEAEIEDIYRKLRDGGKDLIPLNEYSFSKRYAWVEDRFGMTWQLYTSKKEDIIQKIVPTLMFVDKNNGKAEEAMNFYTSIFPDSNLKTIQRYTSDGQEETPGNIEHGQFVLNNFLMMIKDSSYPHSFNFSEGISMVVECNTQEEIDTYWGLLTREGGEGGTCGWLKDKYGMNWQIVPATIDKLMRSPKVQKAMMGMQKLDIQLLRKAAEA